MNTSILFPKKFAKSKIEEQFKKFVELLKMLHINIPFTGTITQMPLHEKLLKKIIKNKRNIDDDGTVALIEEFSTIIQNRMKPELKDLRSFSIPCVVGNHVIYKALCDLGASVSLMLLSICKRLDYGKLKPTKISL